MGKLMNKLMLSCEDATFLITIKPFRKLSLIERIQLRMHLLACVYCDRFDKQNTAIDHGMNELLKSGNSHSKGLSQEKKNTIESAIKQSIDN